MTTHFMRFQRVFLATAALALGPLSINMAIANEHHGHHEHHHKNDIMVHDAYARATPPGAKTSAIFLTLMNNKDEPFSLVSAETDAAGKVELHDVIVEGDLMKMRQVEHIDVAAQSHTELKPGSFHIMLFDLPSPLVEGNEVNLTLHFSDGTNQTMTVPIKKAMNGMSKHSH